MLAHLKAKRRVPTIISSPPSGEKQKENVGDEKNKSLPATAPVRADDVDEAAALVVNDDESCNNHNKEEKEVTKMTCDALCSLSSSSSPSLPVSGGGSQLDYFPPTEGIPFENTTATKKKSNSSKAGCPKQLQLPMFLSSKFQKKGTFCARWFLKNIYPLLTMFDFHSFRVMIHIFHVVSVVVFFADRNLSHD